MTAFDAAKLAAAATGTACRIDYVRRDPAVIKSGKQAAADVATATSSIAKFSLEVQRSWLMSPRSPRTV